MLAVWGEAHEPRKPLPRVSAAANVAVLLGLVIVALQINQNASLARTALINEGNVVSKQTWANLMGERPGEVIEQAVNCPQQVTYTDFMAMDAIELSNMNMLYRDYEVTGESLFTASDWKVSADADVDWTQIWAQLVSETNAPITGPCGEHSSTGAPLAPLRE